MVVVVHAMRALVLTIDLDGLTNIASLHGLGLEYEDPHFFYREPLERFVDFCEGEGLPATLFVVTQDISGIAKDRLRELSAQGFEIACHSHRHDHLWTQGEPGAILNELRIAKATIQEEIGVNPCGFRAPGYIMTAQLMDELESQKFLYDSSVLPTSSSAQNSQLKRLWQRFLRRPSPRLVASEDAKNAPTQPYRPGRNPYEVGHRKLLELPISVDSSGTGTALGFFGPGPEDGYAPPQDFEREEVVMVSLNGLHFTDPSKDSLPEGFARGIKALSVPFSERLTRLRESVSSLAHGRSCLRAYDLAMHLQSEL